VSCVAVGLESVTGAANVKNELTLAPGSAEHSALSFTPTEKQAATGSSGVNAVNITACSHSDEQGHLNTISSTSHCDGHSSAVHRDPLNGFRVPSTGGHHPSAPPGMVPATVCPTAYHPTVMAPAYNWPPVCGVLPPGFTPATLPFVAGAQTMPMPYSSLPVYPPAYGYPMMPPGSWPVISPTFCPSPPVDEGNSSVDKVD